MKVFKQTERKYYKYTYTTFVQPTLYTDRTMAGGIFSVQSDNTSAIYPAFNMTGTWASGTSWSFYFYNPEPLKLTNLALQTGGTWARAILGGTLYGSVDGQTYDTLATFGTSTVNVTMNVPVSTNNYYKYFLVSGTAERQGILLSQCTITATQRTVTNGTASNYDFYEDEVAYHIAKFNGKAYVENSGSDSTPSGGTNLLTDIFVDETGQWRLQWDSTNSEYVFGQYINGAWTASKATCKFIPTIGYLGEGLSEVRNMLRDLQGADYISDIGYSDDGETYLYPVISPDFTAILLYNWDDEVSHIELTKQ